MPKRKPCRKESPAEKKALVLCDHPDLGVSRQCRLLKLSRSSLCYTPVGISAETLELMKKVDKVFTAYPFFGSRQIAAFLRRDNVIVGRHRVRRLMAKMGLEAIFRRPDTSRSHPQHPVCPYLLRTVAVTRPNQVWCSDITFIPVPGGFLDLVAIMDRASRKVLNWRRSNTMHADFRVEAVNEALERFGLPEIMNTDQGSQFTGAAWITTLTEIGVRISMDGRGRCMEPSSSSGCGAL